MITVCVALMNAPVVFSVLYPLTITIFSKFPAPFTLLTQVDFAGASGRCSFSAALVQVDVAGVNAEAVEEVAPELLVVA